MSFFRKKSLFILLIGIIVLVVLVGYSLTKRERLSTPEKFIMDTVGWAQYVMNIPVGFIAGTFSNLDDMKNTYDENKVLREKLAEYKTLIYQVQEIEKENEELRGALDIVDSARDFDPIIANVIARSPERWIEQITISRGSAHGVEKDMAVMTVDGMIGKVQSVSPSTAKVKLITGFDQLNRISATVSRKKEQNIFGLIEGYDKEKEMLIFRVLEESDIKLKEDELVVSSNLGGLFPSGLPIGTIKEVTSDQYGLTKTAYVEPAANLYDLNQVIVVDRKLQRDDASSEEGEE
jgi:rod shape-determining protein MreC